MIGPPVGIEKAVPLREAGMRLFVALTPPPPWRQALARLQQDLGAALPGRALRWVRPEAMHLTIRFLGEVEPRAAEAAAAGLPAAAASAVAPRLRPGVLGGFGGRQRLRVLWLGLEGDGAALARLAERVGGALETAGFPRESRPFRPHLTLARVAERAGAADRARMLDSLRAASAPVLPDWLPAHLELIRSFLEPAGARYETLGCWPLASPQD